MKAIAGEPSGLPRQGAQEEQIADPFFSGQPRSWSAVANGTDARLLKLDRQALRFQELPGRPRHP